MWTLLLGAALAAPTPTIDYTPPTEVHLGVRAGVLEVKAAESGDACDLAAAAALEDLQSKAKKNDLTTLVSVTIQLDGDEACKQRRTGDTVLQSVVHLDAMAIAEDPSLPRVTTERAVTVLATMGAASGGLDKVQLIPIDGKAWWQVDTVPLDGEGEEAEGDPMLRATGLLVREVFPTIGDRASLLGTLPELDGLLYVFEAGKKKSYRGLRVRIPTGLAAAYLKGDLTEEQLLAAVTLDSRVGVDDWTTQDAGTLELEDAGGLRVELRDVDVDEADLEGLEDEEE